MIGDDEARDRVTGGAGGKVVAVEPPRVLELLLVDRDRSARIAGDEADHQLAREGPVLAPDVLDVRHVDAHLLLDLAGDCPLERLAVVDEAGDQGVAPRRPAGLPGQKDPGTVPDEGDHGGMEVRVVLVPAARALLSPFAGDARGRLAAARAVAAGGLP